MDFARLYIYNLEGSAEAPRGFRWAWGQYFYICFGPWGRRAENTKKRLTQKRWFPEQRIMISTPITLIIACKCFNYPDVKAVPIGLGRFFIA